MFIPLQELKTAGRTNSYYCDNLSFAGSDYVALPVEELNGSKQQEDIMEKFPYGIWGYIDLIYFRH